MLVRTHRCTAGERRVLKGEGEWKSRGVGREWKRESGGGRVEGILCSKLWRCVLIVEGYMCTAY